MTQKQYAKMKDPGWKQKNINKTTNSVFFDIVSNYP